MRFIYHLVSILILIGIASLLVGLGMKVFTPEGPIWASVSHAGFLRFADTCLLLGIALSLREIVTGKITKE